ncbi:uncharacterized protein ALTATR162_LOCUS10844 [Alternaria atra]|uniref:Uncharacterized protein n=1 Tax=Alternaria atra TaxID=119953 RepID=A0A8J2IEW2_9PLEO|nr:uncharacterized protein ALTATR162_LOCUS7904 [Alternaria atra]XP_043174419.1 uncharacterized protein ALTATR162_LOCUS10844 [Alternaria atra]CAG5174938.1 unnamed protein product [Alternaria atra]CAG5183969.1 unnamed protein product [Alternaria atra]
MKAELQKTKQDLAVEKSKSLRDSNQINLLCIQCYRLTDRYRAVVASHTALQDASHDLASELRAHKCALDLTRKELDESLKDTDTYRETMLKQDDDYKLVKMQLKEGKEDEIVQCRMLTSKLRSLGKSYEMGRAVYDMLLLQVEGQYSGDKVVLERMREALKEAFGGFFENE